MSRPQDIKPTYTEIMTRILDAAQGTIPLQEFSEQVLALRTIQAKKPLQAVRTQIRQQVGHLLVFLDPETILPIRLAMQGVRFRIQVDKRTVDSGKVQIDGLSYYLPRQFPLKDIRFMDDDGHPINIQVGSVTEKVKSAFGTYNNTVWYADLKDWFRDRKVYPKAYLLFTILDWQSGVFQLEHEPYAKRDSALLQQRNQLLVDLFWGMLENTAWEELLTHEAVPTVYARLPEKSGYPPDHWMVALEKDKRMDVTDWSIRYSDGKGSMLDEMMREINGESRNIPAVPFSREQGKLIYRFKVQLKHQPKIWRTVETQGSQTLVDLNNVIVMAFHHDSEHMGGFWKLVPRQATSRGVMRYREVDLGDVNPLGEGSGAEIKIAELDLTKGDKLKFVYDFGDWIEHVLTLEEIEPPQAKADYPHEVARNKPRYVYCVECEKKGKQTIAKWLCVQCSQGPDDEVLLCEKCARKHEDHYLDEILY
ncbi:MAG TPA: hypothetical protein VMT91_04710 [Anaerolineales bacterium]|nr:hypothetical protein [Anaerolineales bacterium]